MPRPYIADKMISAREEDGFTVEAFQTPIVSDAEFYNPFARQPNDAVVALCRAQASLGNSESWRGFRVSGCVITLMDAAQTVSIIHGVNKKPERDGPINIHAEDMIIDGLTRIARGPASVLAIVGDVQPDDTTKLATRTLVPCYERCTPNLQAAEHILPETLILSASPDLRIVECYDIGHLTLAHEIKDSSSLGSIEFEAPDALDEAEWYEKLVRPLAYLAAQIPPEVQYAYCMRQNGDESGGLTRPPMRFDP